MVLNRPRWLGVLLCAVATPACDQSLFDDHGKSPPDAPGAATCEAPCLADGAADFDGTAGGKNQAWRYLDDHRDRTWTPMTPSSTEMTGADGNRITTCAANRNAAACAMLPQALLISSSGATKPADPAIEFTASSQQVLQLSMRAFLPSGTDQTIRLYRSGREDVLFTGIATAGKLFEKMITVDALARDRFLVAVAPIGEGVSDLALQFTVSSAGMVFPQTCLLAVGFAGATGNAVSDLCKGAMLTYNNDTTGVTAVTLGDDPFAQNSAAANVAIGNYYHSNQTIPQNTALTVQMWIRQRAVSIGGETAWVFSDIDLNETGGLSIGIGQDPAMLYASTCTVATPTRIETVVTSAPWPGIGGWHFVRVVQTGGSLNLCVDGQRKGNIPVPDGQLKTTFAPYLARNFFGIPAGESFFDGNIDDVRVFTGALPCE